MHSFSTSILLLFFTLLALPSCGFRPVYGSYNGNEAISDRLAAITIDPIPHRTGQLLRTHLTALLNPSSTETTPLYRLTVKLDTQETSAVTQQDRTINRYQTTVVAVYTLTPLKGGKAITTGTVQVAGGYNRVYSEFATYSAQQDTLNRLIEQAAQELKTRIALTFSHVQ